MFQQKPRDTIYEYPTEELSMKELLTRRFNLWSDALLYRTLELEVYKKLRKEDASLTFSDQQGQAVSITTALKTQMAIVREARDRYQVLKDMLSVLEQKGDIEALWSDENLTPPLDLDIPSPFKKDEDNGNGEGSIIKA